MRLQPVASIPDEDDGVEFDTELKIQDLPKPQVSNPDRANIRQRPKPAPTSQTNAATRPTRPTLAPSTIGSIPLTNKLPAALVAAAGLEESPLSSATFDQNKGVVVNSSPKKLSGAVLKSSDSKKPDKVKSGDDYYYYYYYYDDAEDEKSTTEAS